MGENESEGLIMSKKPTEECLRNIITPKILEQLGVSCYNDLEFDQGSLKIPTKLNKRFSEHYLNFYNCKTVQIDGEKHHLPLGCEVMLSNATLSTSKRPNLGSFDYDNLNCKSDSIIPEGWDSKLNVPQGETYIHRAHIVAHELFEDWKWKEDRDIKYFTQAAWSNLSSQKASIGKNQAYYEWLIKDKLLKDKDLEINYRVQLIYEEDEILPRGTLIKAVCMKKSNLYNVVDQINVFIPNADPRLDINYKKAVFTIKENTHV